MLCTRERVARFAAVTRDEKDALAQPAHTAPITDTLPRSMTLHDNACVDGAREVIAFMLIEHRAPTR